MRQTILTTQDYGYKKSPISCSIKPIASVWKKQLFSGSKSGRTKTLMMDEPMKKVHYSNLKTEKLAGPEPNHILHMMWEQIWDGALALLAAIIHFQKPLTT